MCGVILVIFRARSCVKMNLLSHQERTVQIRLKALGVVCGVWYSLWPLVQYSSTMHFRFGSLHHVARAAARVLRPFLVARRLVAIVVDHILAAYNDYCTVDTLATMPCARPFDIFMSTSSRDFFIKRLFLNRSPSLSLTRPFLPATIMRVTNN